MAKKSSIEKNKRREKLAKKFAPKRARLKTIANDESLSMEERFMARLKLSEQSPRRRQERHQGFANAVHFLPGCGHEKGVRP